MPWADEIFSDEQHRKFDTVTELTLLFNCFYVSVYIAHILYVCVPKTEMGAAWGVIVTIALLIPPTFITFFLAPIAAKYSCLLTNVLERDGTPPPSAHSIKRGVRSALMLISHTAGWLCPADDLIAHVIQEASSSIKLRNEVRSKLMHHGISVAHEKGLNPDELTGKVVAEVRTVRAACHDPRVCVHTGILCVRVTSRCLRADTVHRHADCVLRDRHKGLGRPDVQGAQGRSAGLRCLPDEDAVPRAHALGRPRPVRHGGYGRVAQLHAGLSVPL